MIHMIHNESQGCVAVASQQRVLVTSRVTKKSIGICRSPFILLEPPAHWVVRCACDIVCIVMKSITWAIRAALVLGLDAVVAQPANIWQFTDCFSSDNTTAAASKLNVTSVYAQTLEYDSGEQYLNLTILGVSGQTIIGQAGPNLCEQPRPPA
jgi:hypothetical protein